ncbi:hypothetical protein F5Y09DRAFT_357310 [Xylaria sp. FL1042]|nr:hypothetical protein F5Y09DRAFT_357310 [Xylaria sp. FL1042]
MAARNNELLYIFHHLFLPPKLPQHQDYDAEYDRTLISAIIDGLQAWKEYTKPVYREKADGAISTIRNMLRAYSPSDGTLNEAVLLSLLAELAEDSEIPLFVKEQNAGILISKSNAGVLFEIFELSPENKATMTTKGRLQRSFPGTSVLISESDFMQRNFQEAIAQTFSDMSKHPVEAMQPKVKKAGNRLYEDRDTNHPGMVSEVFNGVLRSVGQPVRCPTIVKNTRDDVLWDNTRSPWRRSPLWLLVRVCLQLGFHRKTTPVEADIVYKEATIFILCRILGLAKEQSFPSEAIFSMNAKLNRRLLKVGSAIDTRALCYVKTAMKDAYSILSKRWSTIEKKQIQQIDVQKLSELNFFNDIDVVIPRLDTHISWMGSRRRDQSLSTFQPSSVLMVFPPQNLPRLPQHFPNNSKSDAIANLEAFEVWVACHCRQWSLNNLQDSCNELRSLMTIYYNLALPYYVQNPEALSIMLLTLFELWVACDEAAIKLFPWLNEYDPGVPINVLQNLLLPFFSQMKRLYRIEQYLVNRSSSACHSSDKLWYNLRSPQCFSARYFDQSEQLQEKHREIITNAEERRQAKLIELKGLKQKYNELTALARDMKCEYEDILVDSFNKIYEPRHNKANCEKCGYEGQAASLHISIHEWPLPRDITKAKAVVFELFIPAFFQSWRQATFYLLRNVIGMQYSVQSSPDSRYSLDADPHLPSSPSLSSYNNIGLLSEEKPQNRTHRNIQLVSTATEASVCLNNGLNYKYFDPDADQFVELFVPTENVLKMCTYHLPKRSKGLQKYLFRPHSSPDGPAPNVVLADQSETPIYMSVDEMRDLATLPLGHHIQFHNILVQLAAPSLDFRKDETTIFVLQCLYQSGPHGDTPLRAGHLIMDNNKFASCLLENVEVAWSRVKENWESAQALVVLAAITTRVLSLASSEMVQQRCLRVLRTLCTGAFTWVGLLRDKSHKASTQDDRAFFRSKSVDIALICVSCFDVEDEYLSSILKLECDASIFIQCSILIQEGKRVDDLVAEPTLSCLNLRFHRLLYRSSSILSATHAGLSDAVKKSWSGYREGGDWRVVDDTTHWLVTETAPDSEGICLQVHYSLLSGELLVNGLPLSRPPSQYEAHPMWPTLFGRVAVEVMPPSSAGMHFSAKMQHEGYDVQFRLHKTGSGNTDLLVQASKSATRYETIPARLLEGVFPDHFVNDFVHWYDCINDKIQFRRLTAAWDRDSTECVLSRSGGRWRLTRKGSAVLSVNSTTSAAIANSLRSIAERSDIHTLQPSDGSPLEVEIPALRLGFFLTLGESNLRSREFRGMSVDGDQSLGTLIGFTNKLILKHEHRRLALVPEGPVSWESDNDHIRVMIVSKASITKVHALRVDSELGRLVDNGDLQGKLYLSYLHALTSYCLPDPLTKRTGVEQALWILNSASVRSFGWLSQGNIDILARIALLTPKRQYYPRNERVMQTISWVSDLSYLSQHDWFYKVVASIFEQARQNSIFYPDLDSKQLDICCHIDTDVYLMERDRIRSSTFRISGFGAEEHTTKYDGSYHGRDRDQSSTRGINAYVLSSIIFHERSILHTRAPSKYEFWRFISSTPAVRGPDQSLHISQLKYSATAANSGLDLSQWPVLHKILSAHSSAANKFSTMVWLSAIAAHEEADIKYLQVLALCSSVDELKAIELPSIQVCHPPKGYEATSQLLNNTVRSNLLPFSQSPEAKMASHPGEKWGIFRSRRDKKFKNSQSEAVRNLASQFCKQWPRRDLIPLGPVDQSISDYIRVRNTEITVRKQFEEWFDNLLLFNYLQRIEAVLSRLDLAPLTFYKLKPAVLASSSRDHAFVSVSDLFAGSAPSLPCLPGPLELPRASNHYEHKSPRLDGLIDALERTSQGSQFEVSYIKDLRTSMQSLQVQVIAHHPNLSQDCSISILHQHLHDCKKSVDRLYSDLSAGIAHKTTVELGHGPRCSPLLFLQQLSNKSWKLINQSWQKLISRYGIALTALQRAERLVEAAHSQSEEALVKEMNNVGHINWDPIEYPEWLLLEVESSIMIRDVQQRIASEMINPSSNCNAVMQLNMGEGKSSVIVPMVATELANGSQLTRVIVAKPQSKQMAQMLTSKLGGLLGRRVYHMPFSRSININSTQIANAIGEMAQECRDSGGVLLVQPEHILSFQLLGVEHCCSKNTNKQVIGKSLIRIQDFFDDSSRDIVDESDENFSPKFELVYTMGAQRPIEMSPARWLCTQQVLDLVRLLAADVADQARESIVVNGRSDGGFPKVRILKADAGKILLEKVASHICKKGFDGFPITRQPEHIREAVFKYITQYSLSQEEINTAEQAGDEQLWTEGTKSLLLLLRGILAGGILTFVLSKRWRVNFGLATPRTPPTQLAVPYRAKDNPTLRSEFSHPDVVIALTCLTYYYGGLGNDDLFIALGHLVESDQASIEYDVWVKDAPHLPASFRQLDGINLKDRSQCINDVFPYLRYGKSIIDYFLGHIVFPKQVKEFPYKLSASGWDIGKTKVHHVTGFSGTNDSRKLLPIDMKNLDLPSQLHTNALVLEYLLQPENTVMSFSAPIDASMTDAERFIKTVVDLERPTRVILDVGAQILELNNKQVAQTWLHMVTDTKTQAVVFVNDSDELCVIDRQGRLEPLQISLYATQLDSCLIFLDEAHTRGIDLKLPDDYRAAVTLGANLTKDRLVQACMRMRKLGKGQSVVFCVSTEIQAKIRECSAMPVEAIIRVKDVLHWAISETFSETRRSMPLWAAQGDRFLRQNELWKQAQIDGATSMSNNQAEKLLEDEAQPIVARYGPRPAETTAIASMLHSDSPRIGEIMARCNEFEHLHFNSSTLEEEQERELSPEIEEERQVQRPPPALPVDHSLHQDIEKFIATGCLMPTSPAYMHAFNSLRDTSAAQSFVVSQLSSGHLFVTADFAKTVEASGKGYFSDSFQRPVQWILSSRAKDSNVIEVLIIISPYEAEKLMPKFQQMKAGRVNLHLYKPRSHTVHRSFDRLDFFNNPDPQVELKVPPALLAELNLFAGQLYFSVYEDYLETCKLLGLAHDVPKNGQVVDMDGYIVRDSNADPKFDKSPVELLRILTSTIRRNGQDISKTHMGSMLHGKLLQRSDIEGKNDGCMLEEASARLSSAALLEDSATKLE